MKEYKKEYLKYVIEHRKNIKKACKLWKPRLDKNERSNIRHIYFTHDLSKYSKAEFDPYAKWFYGEYGVNYKTKDNDISTLIFHDTRKLDFEKAWIHHYEHNKHHWDYWCYNWELVNSHKTNLSECKLESPREMPFKYIVEMIIDWTAMSFKFGDSPQEFYLNNYNKIELHRETRFTLEVLLGLLEYKVPIDLLEYKTPIDYCSKQCWMTIKELKNNIKNIESLNDILYCKYTNIDYDKYDI